MKIIALTGGIGAGKSTICHEFERLGAKIIDSDKISRKVMEEGAPAYSEVVSYFDTDILKTDGSIDRERLRDIVFGDNEKLKVLNGITHKYIFKEINKDIDKTCGYDIIVVDVPLLFQSKVGFKYDYSVAVIADIEIRIDRVVKRSGMTRDEVMVVINAQLSNEELKRRSDFCVYNNGGIDDLFKQVRELYQKLAEE